MMLMDTTISERLLSFIQTQKMSVRAFERRCNLTNGYVKSITDNLSAQRLDKILREFPLLNREWLMHGSGDMLLPAAPSAGASASGDGSTAVVGDENNVNSAEVLLRAFDEIAAARLLVERANATISKRDAEISKRDEQIDRLLSLLEKAQGA